MINRREFLFQSGGGLGGIALAYLLGEEQARATGSAGPPGADGGLHHRPRAKRVVQLFMSGAASHVDTFDYKPALARDHGKKWDPGENIELFQDGHGLTLASPWSWTRYGKSGKFLNEIVAPLGECVDDMAFIHSMVGKTGVHSQATYLQATGFQTPGFPGMGSWISYGLGTLNENLPTFVVLPDHRGYASNGPRNWAPGFLPAEHQGTIIWPGLEHPIANLFPQKGFVNPQSDREGLELIKKLNRRQAALDTTDSRLSARVRSYELAASLQLSAPEALNIADEPRDIREMYGLHYEQREYPKEINSGEETYHFGLKCLVARRLLERGVRFVQIWSGNDNRHPRRNWDSHEDLRRDHGPLSIGMARGTAALIKDLKDRGLLEDTVILWTTEFGRMPCAQSLKGRDHNPFTFTNWLAGGGIRGGTTYGPSDEWGYKPADRDNPTTVYDVHATILHLLGIDHERLTHRHNGIDRRLTDVHGHVLHDILA